jgi:hypothetical protein
MNAPRERTWKLLGNLYGEYSLQLANIKISHLDLCVGSIINSLLFGYQFHGVGKTKLPMELTCKLPFLHSGEDGGIHGIEKDTE